MVLARKHELEVFELRAQGKTYNAIAATLGMSTTGVKKSLKLALEKVSADRDALAKEYLATGLERLRMATEAIIERVQSGDLDAIDTMLRIETRVARLLALDAPARWPTDEFGRSVAPGVTVDFDALSDAQLEGLRLLGLGEASVEAVSDDA